MDNTNLSNENKDVNQEKRTPVKDRVDLKSLGRLRQSKQVLPNRDPTGAQILSPQRQEQAKPQKEKISDPPVEPISAIDRLRQINSSYDISASQLNNDMNQQNEQEKSYNNYLNVDGTIGNTKDDLQRRNSNDIAEPIIAEEVRQEINHNQNNKRTLDHKQKIQEQQAKAAAKAAEAESTKPSGTSEVAFECNICLEQANEPVVTQCGHLYCWKCIYQWMEQPRVTLLCPVCKSGISKDKVIPIFTKENTKDPRKKEENKQSEDIPNRPGGQRSAPEPNQNYNGNNWFGGGDSNFQMSFGVFPFMFTGISLNSIQNFFRNGNINPNSQNNNEETDFQKFARLIFFFVTICFTIFGGDVFFLV